MTAEGAFSKWFCEEYRECWAIAACTWYCAPLGLKYPDTQYADDAAYVSIWWHSLSGHERAFLDDIPEWLPSIPFLSPPDPF